MEGLRLQLAAANGNVLASSKAGTQNQVINGDFFAAFLQNLLGENADTAALDGMTGEASGDFDLLASLLSGNVESTSGFLENLTAADGGKSDITDDLSARQNAMSLASGLLSGAYGFDWLTNGSVGGANTNADSLGLSGITSSNDLSAILGSGMNGLFSNGLSDGLGTSGSSNSTGSDLLQKLMLVESAEKVFKSSAFDNVSESDKLQAVNDFLQGNTESMNNILQNAQLTAQNKLQTAQVSAAQTPAAQTAQTQTAGGYSAAQPTNGQAAQNNAAQTAQNGIAVTQTRNTDAADSGSEAFESDMGFQSSVYKAQQLMKSNKTESAADYQAAQTTQAAQNGAQTVPISNGGELPQAVDIADISQKLAEGLQNGSISEQKDYTVTLKPEGLGEVTIKLAKVQGQTVVSIAASNETAARLLNEQLPSLRFTMQSMDVMLNPVSVSQQYDFSGAQQQMNQNGQRFSAEPYTAAQDTGAADAAEDTGEYFDDGRMSIYA